MKRLFITLILLASTVCLFAQNDDEATKKLSEQEILYRSFMSTPEALRTVSANSLWFYNDSLSYGTPGDSISTIYPERSTWYIFSYKDTGSTEALGGLRDSVKIEYYDSLNASWGLIGVKAITDDEMYSDVIYSGSSYTRGFFIYSPVPFGRIRVSLLNYRASHPARKGYFTLIGLR